MENNADHPWRMDRLARTQVFNYKCVKSPFTPSKSERDSEKDQRTSERDQRKKFKHQRKCLLSISRLLGVNGP